MTQNLKAPRFQIPGEALEAGDAQPSRPGRNLSARTPRLDERVPLLKNAQLSRYSKDTCDSMQTPPKDASPTAQTILDAFWQNSPRDMWQQRGHRDVFVFDHNGKMVYYDHEALNTFKAFTLLCRSAFFQRPVAITFFSTLLVAAASASLIFLFLPWASRLDTKRFSYFCTFLKVFISFMLGIYIQQAFKRWWYAVSTYEKFHISVRQLLYLLHSIRTNHLMRQTVEDYCLASSYVLALEVAHAQSNHRDPRASMMSRLRWLEKQGFLIREEVQQLKQMSTVSVLAATRSIWSWIGELLSHIRNEDGNQLAPPMQVRMWALSQQCVGEIENLKLNVTMQVPFTYAHLLALLVHVNNILMGLTCGLSLGSALAEVNQRRQQLAGTLPSRMSYAENMREFYEAVQVTGVQVLILMIEPVLYMSFLHIAHMLCYPFGDEHYHLPLETFVARLHQEFNSMSENRVFFRETLIHKRKLDVFNKESQGKNDDLEENEQDLDDDCD